VQTRPGGNEPEREPEDGSEADERDPFTPKVRPSDEDEPKKAAGLEEPGESEDSEEAETAGEPEDSESFESSESSESSESPESSEESGADSGEEEAEKPDLAETMDLRSLAAEPEEPAKAEGGGKSAPRRPKKHAGQMAAETVNLADLGPKKPAEDSVEESAPGEKPAAEGEEAAEEPDLAETVNLAAEPELSEKPEPSEKPELSEKPEPDLAETMNLRDLLPEEAAFEVGGKPEPGEKPDTAETVNLRDLLPEDSAPEGAGDDQPAIRRRTPAGEPPRRRPAPGGQPPRRPGPGQDPRRAPHGPQGPAQPGPKRRPPSDRAPEGRAAAASAAAASGAAAAASGPAEPTKPPKPQKPPVSLGRRRLFAALWPPRLSRNQAVVGVLLAALGAALAIQVRATNTSDEILRGARADDLVNILDEVTSRGQSLDAELRNLETQNAAIQDSTDKAQAALAQAQQKAKDLQILAGTVKAKGSGITMTISDPQAQVKSATLLNALEELRAAGAEVVQIDDVRVVVSSSFVDTADGGIALDGHELAQPYVFKVIGDPTTLGPAMQIPGGVVATVKTAQGANVTITPGQILVDALAPLPNPTYAKAG
jgi:uncharacterized protein YlxW (UPF0749 family)